MSLTNPKNVVTEERLNEYHRTILPYLGGNSMVACGGGYAPIGTVIAYMGTTAPSDFLICDGTVYNIADYTELADFFEAQFGSANFFGGDGNTTFAVPDLRGEFLRGTGTNSHANQGSGANVGVHQDGTVHIGLYIADSSNWCGMTINRNVNRRNANGNFGNASPDYSYTNGFHRSFQTATAGDATETEYTPYTSRPTNTSVLYCIKAKSQGNGYSLDEQIVGTWIDGKPIYQKTWTGLNITPEYDGWTVITNQPSNYIQIKNSVFLSNSSNISGIGIDIDSPADGMYAGKIVALYSQNLKKRTITEMTLQYTKTTDTAS